MIKILFKYRIKSIVKNDMAKMSSLFSKKYPIKSIKEKHLRI